MPTAAYQVLHPRWGTPGQVQRGGGAVPGGGVPPGKGTPLAGPGCGTPLGVDRQTDGQTPVKT